MIDSAAVLQARRRWVEMYQSTGNATLTCRRCGISKPTLRKWWQRYQSAGPEGLRSRSRRPHKLRPRKVTPEQETLILQLRHTRHLGPKGLQRELLRLHLAAIASTTLSTRPIWKVLHAHQVSVLRPTLHPREPKLYTRPTPGDRVQVDTCKVGRNLYQYTAIDDCTRLRVLGLYAGRTAANAVHFLQERLLAEFPFPIQRVQTDRGGEFIGAEFQDALREQHIKFRPNRPRAPHPNGKVERSQRTDRMEFWATVDPSASRQDLEEQLIQWQHFYNQERTHSAIGSKTPYARLLELTTLVPTHETVYAAYLPPSNRYVTNNHYVWTPNDKL